MEGSSKASTYGTDFKELERLGGGGQGYVFKALHLLDRREYAVKKVRFNKNRERELLREVNALSALSHPNIVRYHSSWTEDGDISGDESDLSSLFRRLDAESRDDTEGQSEETSQGTNSEVCSSILYIQMELCTSTLRDWIDGRNTSSSDKKETIMDIFREILQGVEYIHEKDLIHRDLKPENIFLQIENHVKIGDFGLAKGCMAEEDEEAQSNAVSSGSRTRYGVGTPPYAAPEIVSCVAYDVKSDMYSLGVIFLEMCHKMTTRMEVGKAAQDLQNGQVPTEHRKTKEWRKQASAMRKMAQKEPSKRPSASDMLCGPLFLNQEQEIKMLKARLEKKKALIKALRARLRKASPQLLIGKLKKANALLEIKSSQINRLQERYNSPDLEHHFEQVPGSIPLSGIQFRSKRGQDFFARMCKGVCLMYRMFQEDLIYLVASEVLSFGSEGLQEFGGQNQFEMVLRKCFEVAEQINKDDPNWISKQREVEQVFTIRALMSSHGGYNRQPSTQEAQAATESNARRRRRRKSRRQSAQQPTEN